MTTFLTVTGLMVVLGVLCLIAGVVCADRFRATFLRPSGAHALDPAREVADTARSEPSPLETEAATGGAPVMSEAGAPRIYVRARFDALLAEQPVDYGRLTETAPGGIPVYRDGHVLQCGGRPVNGRPMPDQPRRTLDPVPVLAGAELGEARAAAQAAGARVRAGRQPASSDLLERVLTDLRKWR